MLQQWRSRCRQLPLCTLATSTEKTELMGTTLVEQNLWCKPAEMKLLTLSMYPSNSLYSVGAASNARTVGMELIAASDTLFPSASLLCINFVRLRTNSPYHLERTVMTGTLIKAKIESCHDTMNMKMRTPITCTSDLKNT